MNPARAETSSTVSCVLRTSQDYHEALPPGKAVAWTPAMEQSPLLWHLLWAEIWPFVVVAVKSGPLLNPSRLGSALLNS